MTSQDQLDAVIRQIKATSVDPQHLYHDLRELVPHFDSIWIPFANAHDTIYRYSRAYWDLNDDPPKFSQIRDQLHLISSVSAFSREGVVRSDELELLLLRRLAGEPVDAAGFDRREIAFHQHQLAVAGLADVSWSSNGSYIYELQLTALTPKGYELLKIKATPEPVHRILFLSADPRDADRLRLGEEYREVATQIKSSRARDKISLHAAFSVRPSEFTQALLDTNPTIVHFSGHGTKVGAVCFEDHSGNLLPIPGEVLAEIFVPFSHLKLVVLNACFSAVQAQAIARVVECVIGMKREIGDPAAIAYSVGLYQALGAGRSIADAHKLGCAQIRLWGLEDYVTPSIFFRS